MKKRVLFLFILVFSCSENDDLFIYNGRLDADLLRLSAKAGGEIIAMNVDEGMTVTKGQVLAVIDTAKTWMQKQQQLAQILELKENVRAIEAQIAQVEIQLRFARENLDRTSRMVSGGAATENKRDELQTQVDVLSAQLKMHRRSVESLNYKEKQLRSALEITDLMLADSKILCPLEGIVINRFRLKNEFVGTGTPLLEVADLTSMEAKIYIPLSDLNRVRLGQTVDVYVDGIDEPFRGTLRWISSQSEFTPKTILTREARSTLVYMVKIAVPNPEGRLKIGMPVDIRL